MAGGSHRRDGTGRDGTGLPLHAAAESCCSVCSTQAPQLPAAPGERLRAAGRPPALLLLRPAAPAGPGRAGPPHTVPPSPAPRPGAARPRRSARPGGGSTEKRLPSRRGSPAGVGGWGRAGRRRAGEGDARPAATGEPRGESGDTPACPPPPPRVVVSLLLSSFGSSSRVGGDHRWGDPSPCPSLWENSAGMGFLTQSCLLPGVLVGLGAWEGWRDGWRMPSLGGMEGWMESTCAARPKTQGRARALATAPRDAQRPQIPWCCGADTGGSGMPFLGMAAVLPYAAGSGPGVGREAR